MKNGFRKARHDVIAALESGNYLHVARGDIEVKNLLAMGEVTAEVLIRVIRSCSGVHHHCSPHTPCRPSMCTCSSAWGGTSSSISSSQIPGSSVFISE
jgi:hypothetical protein